MIIIVWEKNLPFTKMKFFSILFSRLIFLNLTSVEGKLDDLLNKKF